MESKDYAFGYDAQTGEYVDMVKLGIIDPTKVVRTAIQDAASIAGLLITTEAIIAEAPKKDAGPAMPAGRRHGRHGLLIHRSHIYQSERSPPRATFFVGRLKTLFFFGQCHALVAHELDLGHLTDMTNATFTQGLGELTNRIVRRFANDTTGRDAVAVLAGGTHGSAL